MLKIIMKNYQLNYFMRRKYIKIFKEKYKLLKSKSGIIKLVFLATLQCTVFENDIVQNISGLHFATKDSRKLYIQKMQLLQQAKSGFVVNYFTDNNKKALKKTI